MGAELQVVTRRSSVGEGGQDDSPNLVVETVDLSTYVMPTSNEVCEERKGFLYANHHSTIAYSIFLSHFLRYAVEESHYDAMFLLAVNDIVCNPGQVTDLKLRMLQEVFLSHRAEQKKCGAKLIVSNDDKLLINPDNVGGKSPEQGIDDINKVIDSVLSSKHLGYKDLMQELRLFAEPIVTQEMKQFKMYSTHLKMNSFGGIGVDELKNPVLRKLEKEVGFCYCKPDPEHPEASLFKHVL